MKRSCFLANFDQRVWPVPCFSDTTEVVRANCFTKEGFYPVAVDCYTRKVFTALEWRNWQTHGTQNPAGFTSHVGSTPTSSTNKVGRLLVIESH